MSTLPFKVYDLVQRTAVDYAPELDAWQGITREMVGEVAAISHTEPPMFTVLFRGNAVEGIYFADELKKVGYCVHDWNNHQNDYDVLFEVQP